jgi:hypothetical protein
MTEPSLIEHQDRTAIEAYRFLWLRTFDNPIAIRIEKTGSGAKVWVTQLDGKGGYDPGSVSVKRAIEVNQARWTDITNSVALAGFWSMQTEDDRKVSSDGAQWILEGVAGGRYHAVDRWSVKSESSARGLEKYTATCVHFLEVGGFDLKKEKVY